jgi:hypothetical protein
MAMVRCRLGRWNQGKPVRGLRAEWRTVRELDAGWFDYYEHVGTKTRRFLGVTSVTTTRGLPRKYDFAWLAINESAEKWKELKLEDSDF